MATVGWYPPLPSGWEARWDPNQKAYFYIDHVSKVTTWEDPRFTAPTQNEAAKALSPGRSSHHAQRGQGHQGETIPMRDMQRHTGHGSHTQHHQNQHQHQHQHQHQQDTGFSRGDSQALVQKVKAALPTCPENVILQALFKNQNSYNMTVHELMNKGYTKDQPTLQLSNTPAAHLKELFPAAPAGVIQDVLAMCGNSEDEAKDQLIDLGFQMTRSSGSTSRTVSPSHSPRHHDSSVSPRHSHSNNRRHSGNHSHQPARPQISDSEKDRLVSKLAVEFPNMGKDIIKMALDAANYNEDSAKRVLGGTATRGHSSRASSATTALYSRPSSSQQGPAVHVSSADMEPVIFGSERSETRPSASGTSRETTPSQSQRTVTTSASSSRHSGTSGQQQQKAKQVTKMSEQLLTTTNDMLNHLASSCCLREGQEVESSQSENSLDRKHQKHQPRAKRSKATTPKTTSSAVTSQPRTYVSAYRTQANGPNPALRNGPDKSLLLSDYTSAQGPNPDFRCGPDPSRVQGSQGALGPDPSLRCGPQSTLHMGPSMENLSGRGGVLVSNV